MWRPCASCLHSNPFSAGCSVFWAIRHFGQEKPSSWHYMLVHSMSLLISQDSSLRIQKCNHDEPFTTGWKVCYTRAKCNQKFYFRSEKQTRILSRHVWCSTSIVAEGWCSEENTAWRSGISRMWNSTPMRCCCHGWQLHYYATTLVLKLEPLYLCYLTPL